MTCTFLPGLAFMYSSAQRWARMTIVSEPFTVTAALARSGIAVTARASRMRFIARLLLVSGGRLCVEPWLGTRRL